MYTYTCILLPGTASCLEPIYFASYDIPTTDRANENVSFKMACSQYDNCPILQSICTYVLHLDNKINSNAYKHYVFYDLFLQYFALLTF